MNPTSDAALFFVSMGIRHDFFNGSQRTGILYDAFRLDFTASKQMYTEKISVNPV